MTQIYSKVKRRSGKNCQAMFSFQRPPSKQNIQHTTKHTNLGCGSLQAKRFPNREAENGKNKNNEKIVYTTHWLHTGHPLAEQVKLKKLNETKWNCASHPLAITNNANKIYVSHPLAIAKNK